jgi:hypothetical protein
MLAAHYMLGRFVSMAPISFGVLLPTYLQDLWRQRLADADMPCSLDEKLMSANANDPDVIFVGRICTSFRDFPMDVCRHGDGLLLQVYFGAHREELQKLIADIFPEAE